MYFSDCKRNQMVNWLEGYCPNKTSIISLQILEKQEIQGK